MNTSIICPQCGSTRKFSYLEDIVRYRVVSSFDGHTLTVENDYEIDGRDDGEYGRLQCAECLAEFPLPESEDPSQSLDIDFS